MEAPEKSPRKPIPKMATTMARYPKIGFRENYSNGSEILCFKINLLSSAITSILSHVFFHPTSGARHHRACYFLDELGTAQRLPERERRGSFDADVHSQAAHRQF